MLQNNRPATHPEHNALAVSLSFSSSPVHPFCSSHPCLIFLSSLTFFSLHKYCVPVPSCSLSLHRRHIFSVWFACAPVYVYIAEPNQQKIANPPQTPADKRHTNTALPRQSTSPARTETLQRQLYGPWLARTTGCSSTERVCVCARIRICMCMWQFDESAGFPAFWEETLIKRAITQSALSIQHSRSMTCQPRLWITVMDVLIYTTHIQSSLSFFFTLSLKQRDAQRWERPKSGVEDAWGSKEFSLSVCLRRVRIKPVWSQRLLSA